MRTGPDASDPGGRTCLNAKVGRSKIFRGNSYGEVSLKAAVNMAFGEGRNSDERKGRLKLTILGNSKHTQARAWMGFNSLGMSWPPSQWLKYHNSPRLARFGAGLAGLRLSFK